ncbi:MAG: hypothetical protein QOC96_3129 [Acidobacteriota bacterium]|jgi:hypothetical protein|nr:hypothetical protein [Acidobacteriota bacterium]
MNFQIISSSYLKALTLSAALLMAVGLGACGGNKPISTGGSTARQSDTAGSINPAGSSRKPCEFMARSDAETAVGQPLPQTTENIPLKMCDYNAEGFAAGASLTMSDWEGIKGAATGGRVVPTPISGIGDEALNLNGSNGSNLYVRKGSQGFLLVLNGPNIDGLADHGLSQEKELAVKILANF